VSGERLAARGDAASDVVADPPSPLAPCASLPVPRPSPLLYTPPMPETSIRRVNERATDAPRPVSIELGVLKYAEGSALIQAGDTRVLVAATIESRIPPFLTGSGRGWATAEYAMLPRATSTRNQREVTRGRPSGRTAEIQRLIGRSLRAVLDLSAFPERTLTIDCDVLQADGGTRTASITGAYVAAVQALSGLLLAGDIERWPVRRQLAAISVGLIEGVPLLDLDAGEDLRADVDMNVIGTHDGRLVEIQGTGEESTFTRAQLDELIDLAFQGIGELARIQNEVLADVLADLQAVQEHGRRKAAKPKNEDELWAEP
jgi:ribonuclease PH